MSYEFLEEFLPLIKNTTKVYLETNATLYDELVRVKKLIDIVSADIKLPSCTNGADLFDLHEKFFKNCEGLNTFAKIVFDKNITQEEIDFCTYIGKNYDIELVLQPKMDGNIMSVSSEFCQEILNRFTYKYANTRLIPQVHKFLNVR